MGGGFVLLLAAQQGDKIGAAVPFYGVGPDSPHRTPVLTTAVQGHYGEKDDFYPVDQARAQEEQIRSESGAQVEFLSTTRACLPQRRQPDGDLTTADAKLAWTGP